MSVNTDTEMFPCYKKLAIKTLIDSEVYLASVCEALGSICKKKKKKENKEIDLQMLGILKGGLKFHTMIKHWMRSIQHNFVCGKMLTWSRCRVA
jgi:hypoxanthine-guanine phosphoribosyltransferase